jgi:hypothetical protein
MNLGHTLPIPNPSHPSSLNLDKQYTCDQVYELGINCMRALIQPEQGDLNSDHPLKLFHDALIKHFPTHHPSLNEKMRDALVRFDEARLQYNPIDRPTRPILLEPLKSLLVLLRTDTPDLVNAETLCRAEAGSPDWDIITRDSLSRALLPYAYIVSLYAVHRLLGGFSVDQCMQNSWSSIPENSSMTSSRLKEIFNRQMRAREIGFFRSAILRWTFSVIFLILTSYCKAVAKAQESWLYQLDGAKPPLERGKKAIMQLTDSLKKFATALRDFHKETHSNVAEPADKPLDGRVRSIFTGMYKKEPRQLYKELFDRAIDSLVTPYLLRGSQEIANPILRSILQGVEWLLRRIVIWRLRKAFDVEAVISLLEPRQVHLALLRIIKHPLDRPQNNLPPPETLSQMANRLVSLPDKPSSSCNPPSFWSAGALLKADKAGKVIWKSEPKAIPTTKEFTLLMRTAWSLFFNTGSSHAADLVFTIAYVSRLSSCHKYYAQLDSSRLKMYYHIALKSLYKTNGAEERALTKEEEEDPLRQLQAMVTSSLPETLPDQVKKWSQGPLYVLEATADPKFLPWLIEETICPILHTLLTSTTEQLTNPHPVS